MMLLPVYHTSFLILSYVLYNTEKHDYYRYCDACLGSDRDLFINEYIAKNNSS